MAVIDLRNPQGRFGGSFQAAAGILTSIQAANKAKANRSTLNEISKARALNPNATIDEILAGLPQAQEASGIAGFIDRITGAGQGDVVSQLQASRITTPVQEAQIAASKALGERRGALTKDEVAKRDRQAKLAADKAARAFGRATADDATAIITEAEQNAIKTAGESDFFKPNQFSSSVTALKSKRVKVGKLDKANGSDVYKATLDQLLQSAIKERVSPSTVLDDFNAWWDKKAEKTTFGFREFVPRSEFEDSKQIELSLGGIGGTGRNVNRGDDSVRRDGTQKGNGFLGPLQLPDGKVATEFTIGTTDVTGKEMDIPTLVPTLTQAEIDLMVNDIIPNNKPIPKSIIRKAIAHAKKRVGEGKSVFVGIGDILEKGSRKFKIVGFDTDGEPLVEEVK